MFGKNTNSKIVCLVLKLFLLLLTEPQAELFVSIKNIFICSSFQFIFHGTFYSFIYSIWLSLV